MHAENFVVDQRGNRNAVENILELLPDADGVAALTLVIKPIYPVDLAALVVTSEKEEILLILTLVGQEQDNNFEGLLSTVDIVSQKKVVGFRWVATIVKQLHEVSVLAMDVAADLNGGF